MTASTSLPVTRAVDLADVPTERRWPVEQLWGDEERRHARHVLALAASLAIAPVAHHVDAQRVGTPSDWPVGFQYGFWTQEPHPPARGGGRRDRSSGPRAAART
jgi:hypothetical protein